MYVSLFFHIMTKDELLEQAKSSFGIAQLNAMQNDVLSHWCNTNGDMIVYSPTGSGKTLAFAMPALLSINGSCSTTQIVVIAPSRELIIQTFEVIKKLSPLTSVTCCYGGHNSVDETRSLNATPTIVISTPGRLLDHITRGNIDLEQLKCLVLDEFDKSLELGFYDEMSAILKQCPTTARKIMTSATVIEKMPNFVRLVNYHIINHLKSQDLVLDGRITLWQVNVSQNNKLDTLLQLLYTISDERTIVFANTRDSAKQAYEFLTKKRISVALYHGTLAQIEREKAVAMLNNGTVTVLVATDLASRGLDIMDIKHIIHFELPLSEEILIHRNGRTARVDALGDAYFIKNHNEQLPHYINNIKEFSLNPQPEKNRKVTSIATLYISAGKKEKVSRGDIVGYLTSNASSLTASEIGKINIFDHYSLVAVPSAKAKEIINSEAPHKLKKQKVKLSLARPITITR